MSGVVGHQWDDFGQCRAFGDLWVFTTLEATGAGSPAPSAAAAYSSQNRSGGAVAHHVVTGLTETTPLTHNCQRDLSKMAGVPQSHISKIESNQVGLRLSGLIALANALDLAVTLVPRKAIPARGIGGHWIVKLPSRDFRHVPENEFSMMTLAKMIGIDVPAIDLVDVSSIHNLPEGFKQLGFIVERFDRTDDGRSVGNPPH